MIAKAGETRGSRTALFVLFLVQFFFCILFNLSQHEMTKFSALGPRKNCAGPSYVTLPDEVGVVFSTKSFK